MAASWFPLVLIVATLAPASAHDFDGVLAEATRHASTSRAQLHREQAKATELKTLSVVARSANLPLWTTQQVIKLSGNWPTPHAFSICFDQSAVPGLRRRIASTIELAWPLATMTDGALSYGPSFDSTPPNAPPDCGDYPSSWSRFDIRVAFKPQYGYSAEIGVPLNNEYPTLNLSRFDVEPPPDERFRFLVAHEMGHVLGLAHELQHPDAPPCDWDKAAIMDAQGWTSEAQWNQNMAKVSEYLKNGERGFDITPYDQHSVMHYHFDAKVFRNKVHDPCYIPADNVTPDQRDHEIVIARFGTPRNGTQQATLRASIPAVVRNLPKFPELAKALAKQLQLLRPTP